MADIKNAQANELLGRAAALEAELADTSKNFTLDEVRARVDEAQALKARALVASQAREQAVTVRAEQGHITVPSPEAAAVEATQAEDFKAVSERVVKAFGGPSRYVLALGRRGKPDARAWTAAQTDAHAALRGFQQRVIVGTEKDGSGGEYLLPLTQAPDIFVGANITQPGLLERAPRYACPGRSVRIPYLVQDDDDVARPLSGIAATAIEAEAGEKDAREPVIGQRTVTAYKWAAYTEVGDELLDDDYTGQLTSVLQRAVGGDIANSINLSVTIGGSGTGQPLGALHASNGALLTVNRTTSQQILIGDVLAMLSKGTMGPRSFWIAHPSTIPYILGLQLSSGSQVTYLQNLNGAATGAMLLGYPIVWSHLVSKLGVAGDLALIDPDHYAVVLRREVTMESSIHYQFRNDVTAYRFFARAGGLPIPTDKYSFAASGSNFTYAFSPFVRLGDDATS
jgi:HK97 family phage major capsid protein